MDLFMKAADVSVKSPNVREWEQIEVRLKAAVMQARKQGDQKAITETLADYAKHYGMKDRYVSAGKAQLTIFD